MKTYSLYELNTLVKEAIEGTLTDEYRVEAEISDLSERGGHCYLELVEKKVGGNTPVARARAIIWSNVWTLMKPAFEQVTGQRLASGMKVLLQVYPTYHAAYGFSWTVTDIDATFTIGDMMRKRQEIVRRLKEEGVFNLNKELPLPMFCQHIAVISSPKAAGYGDFCNQLSDNAYGFCFETELFPATMQGEGVEESIIAALNAIYSQGRRFDCVVIIRGGGATSDLAGFDSYALAENVAQFPLPVITGIGHERDDTVLDLVAHTRVKTPTAAAEFLITNLAKTDSFLRDAAQAVHKSCLQRLQLSKERLLMLSTHLHDTLRVHFERQHHRLTIAEERLKGLDPTLLLQRGYSITTQNGKIIKDASSLHKGDEITSIFNKGTITSIIK